MKERNNKTEKKKNQSINIKETYTMYNVHKMNDTKKK